MSKTKPYVSDVLIRSSLDGGSSSGGDHTAVSLRAGAMPSGSMTGDQCEVPATRLNGMALSGLVQLRSLPPTSSTSSGSTLSCLAAMPLSLSAIRSAARWAATAVPGVKRQEYVPAAIDH